jgi:hypothetical protein
MNNHIFSIYREDFLELLCVEEDERDMGSSLCMGRGGVSSVGERKLDFHTITN